MIFKKNVVYIDDIIDFIKNNSDISAEVITQVLDLEQLYLEEYNIIKKGKE